MKKTPRCPTGPRFTDKTDDSKALMDDDMGVVERAHFEAAKPQRALICVSIIGLCHVKEPGQGTEPGRKAGNWEDEVKAQEGA